MSFFKKNPLLSLGLLLLILVGLPAAIFLSQRPADDRSRASKTVILSFAPPSTLSTPISVAPGSTVSIDLMLDPGTNAVSFLKTELTYDASKIQVDEGGFQVNPQAFSQTIQGPFYTAGKVSFSLSVGADGTKAIQAPAKVGTLTFKGLASGVSQVGFSSSSQALSISSDSTPTENVVSNTIPANIIVSGGAVVTPPPSTCSDNPTDTILVIDKSGSMNVAATANKISQAKIAAKNYIDILAKDSRNTVGLVTYSNTATVNSPLTSNFSSVKSQIDSITASGWTCTECGINKANQEIARSTTSNKKVVILLTDGKANYIEGGTKEFTDTTIPEQKALDAAKNGFDAKGTVFYTIGLGLEINGAFLQKMADSAGGKYFPSPSGDDLNTIYNQISQISGKGSISGFVFNDANNNRSFDASEAKLSGWTLQLFPAGSNTPQTFVSNVNGFNITGLCNGSYTLKEVVQNGWKQTLPVDPNGYQININNGGAITDKNFGNNKGNTCADGIDNNNNGLIDDKDPICHTDGNPNNPGTYDPNLPEVPSRCNDKIDNDNNGLIDEKDATCHTDGNADNPNSYDPKIDGERSNTCYDLKDNNGNNLIDIKDPICHTDGNADNPNSYDRKLPEYNTCADKKDNNGNDLIDIADPICHTDKNPQNPNSYDPYLPEIGDGGTNLSLTIFLHGIGNSGDNSNPTAHSLSNKNPLNKTRPVQAFIYNVNNQLISSASGQINYSSASGNYTGKVQTKSLLTAGPYNIRVGTTRHLIRRLPGIQNIVLTGDNALPAVHLVTGDINDDNRLNILDYNILMDCYTDLLPAPSCADQTKKTISDTDDDGLTNQTDYNLFLREIANQPGD